MESFNSKPLHHRTTLKLLSQISMKWISVNNFFLLISIAFIPSKIVSTGNSKLATMTLNWNFCGRAYSFDKFWNNTTWNNLVTLTMYTVAVCGSALSWVTSINKAITAVEVKLYHSLPECVTGIVPSKQNNSFCTPLLYAEIKRGCI